MFIRPVIALLVIFIFPTVANAINVGSVTTFIPSDKDLVGKEIKNESPMGRMIGVKVERIDTPLSSGVVIPFGKEDELLLSPSQLMMPGNTKNIIKFWYQGKRDAKERYYRITFTDEPISDAQTKNEKKYAEAQARAIISTILVVQPREKSIDFGVVSDGVINKGNASLRGTAIGECLHDKKECREIFYVLPGRTYHLKQVNLRSKGAHLSLWDNERFIPVN
ncbi:hypothetical protein [Pantoea sp. 1.19]|uniref:EcpB family pilus assembly chaperone n=1 Tax=Pantoea sp. 1.19 TaxID=1925589 RepID=UPI000948A720|nr:hypothetical protein [Pantoea sp. 1.19]